MEHENSENEIATYELGFLTSSEDTSTVRRILTAHGASVVSERPLEKVRLAYPIQKEQYGFLGAMRFTGVSNVAVLAAALKLEKSLLRRTINHIDLKREASSRLSRSRPAGIRPTQRETEPALTNEAIEKKIEEILQ